MKAEDILMDIRKDTSSGASEIMKKVTDGLLTRSIELVNESPDVYLDSMIEYGRELVEAQPSMAPVFNAVNTVLLAIESVIERNLSTAELGERIRTEVDVIVTSSHKARERIQKEVAPLIQNGHTVLTHSYSSTTIASIKNAGKEGKKFGVVVTESRPLFEGRKTAQLISDAGIAVKLISDMAAFHHLEECNLVLTGADCLCRSGVVNKMGTRGLAFAASQQDVPLYVCSEKGKVFPSGYRLEPDILEMDPGEIWDGPGNIDISNLYFDITPHGFFKGYITEEGILGQPEILELIEKTEVSGYLKMR